MVSCLVSNNKSAELHTEHPGTPSEWTSELEIHARNARRCVVRWAPARGEFTHAHTVYLEPVEQSHGVMFKLQMEEGATLLPVEGLHSPRMVVEHLWAALCQIGIVRAEKRGLKRLRGEFEVTGDEGHPLNDPSLSRKRLNLDDPAPATFDDDDDVDPKDKSALALLAYERREHRRTQARLLAAHDREESHAVGRHEIKQQLADATAELGKVQIGFAQYMQGVIRQDIDEARSEARIDFVTEEMVKFLGPKLGGLVEGLTVMARNYGQQRDPLAVPEPPAEFEGWLLEVYGDSYTDYAGEKVQLRMLVPGTPEYRQAWFDHLILLNNSVEGHTFTVELANKIKLWAAGAAQSLGLDPHLFSRLAFCEGAPEADLSAKADDPDTPQQPGESPPPKGAAES